MKFLNDEFEDLVNLAASSKEKYSHASPFPHIVFHDFFNPQLLDHIKNEFPNLSEDPSLKKFSKNSRKYASKGEKLFGEYTWQLCQYLNSGSFLKFLQELTSMERVLLPDPYFLGGGLHQIKCGGFLDIHADFNKHPDTGLDRRLNLLVYLNKDWTVENGGELELWDNQMEACKASILPTFNTMVIFSTTSNSFHGHPHPVVCSESESRKSLALYYYTNGRPDEEIIQDLESHSTLYQKKGSPVTAGKIIKAITPPLVFDFVRKLKG